MPTAHDFRRAAAVLDDARVRLARTLPTSRRWPIEALAIGPLRTATEATIGVTEANVRTVLAELARQIDEAHRRAAVCQAYTESVRQHLMSADADHPWPRRPAPWVAYG